MKKITKMDIINHKFIILGSYSANVLGQVRGLGEKGIRPYGVLIHKNTFRIDKSKYWAKTYAVDTIEEGLDTVLREFGSETVKPFLYTDRDDVMGLLDRKYDELKDKFYFWNAGEQGRLNKYLNKEEQLKLAKECGMRIPQTEVVKVGEMPKRLQFPIFTKAKDSLNPYWKGNAFICHNEEDLKRAYSVMDCKEIMLQEYIVKDNELPIECISINRGNDICLLGRTYYYRTPQDSFGTFKHVEPFTDSELEGKIKAFIKHVGFTGPFEIEFILDKTGTPYYLETNFRIAQQNYAYAKLGANIPYLYALSTLMNRIAHEEIKYYPKNRIILMQEFEDFKASCLSGDISFWKWIKDVRHTDCFSFYSSSDMLPFLITIWAKIMNVLKKLT